MTAKGTMTRDPELAVMAKIDRLLAAVDRLAAARIVSWLRLKYVLSLPAEAPLPGDPSFRRGIGSETQP